MMWASQKCLVFGLVLVAAGGCNTAAFVHPLGAAIGMDRASSQLHQRCTKIRNVFATRAFIWKMPVLKMSDGDDHASSGGGRRRKRDGTANLDANVRTKLLAETIAPWRTFRLFMYFAFGASALIAGLVTLPVVAAGLSGARTDVDMNKELMNLAIDFGGVVAFAVFAKLDLDKGAELNEEVDRKLQEKKDNKKFVKAMREREASMLSNLNLKVLTSGDGTLQTASVATLQEAAQQNIILVIGSIDVVRDALIAATLLKNDFAKTNILVVPYEIGGVKKAAEDEDDGGAGMGFGKDTSPNSQNRPFVAQHTGEGWKEYIDAELADAVRQNGESVKEDGIAIVVDSSGVVLRRGVGQVPWQELVEEIRESNKEKKSAQAAT